MYILSIYIYLNIYIVLLIYIIYIVVHFLVFHPSIFIMCPYLLINYVYKYLHAYILGNKFWELYLSDYKMDRMCSPIGPNSPSLSSKPLQKQFAKLVDEMGATVRWQFVFRS